VGVAFDREIESFRNGLFPGYKTGEGVEPELLAQFPLAEQATAALGFVVWPMIEFEADDAIASAVARYSASSDVDQIVICSPDKDLAQCISGRRIVGRDRIRRTTLDEAGVVGKFGVAPQSMPDWLGLVGDAADGIPGIPRWGAKSAAAVLAAYGRIEQIPASADDWKVGVRGAATLAANLAARRADALLYRDLATLRRDVPLRESLADLRWRGPSVAALTALAAAVDDARIVARATRIAESLGLAGRP
jgi:5'-3' exonuclease